MIDLTNDNHKRGVMILSSKDVRTIDNSLFNWKVHTGCVESYLSILRSRISNLDIDPSIKDASLSDIDFCMNWVRESAVNIDKAREIFR